MDLYSPIQKDEDADKPTNEAVGFGKEVRTYKQSNYDNMLFKGLFVCRWYQRILITVL